MLKFNYYYLLYKLKHRPELWIVKEDINKLNLVKSIENFDSNVEKYYKSFILKRRYSCFFDQIHGLFLDTLLILFLSLLVNNRKNY